MSPLILKRVKSARRRLNWINLIRRTVKSVFIGLIAAAVFMLLTRVRDIGLFEYAWPGVGAALLCSLFGALVWAFVTRINDTQAALAVDERLGLRERISTAMYYAQPKTPLEQMVLEDAERHAERIHPRENFRFELERRHYWSLLPAVLIGALSFVPPISIFGGKDKKKDEMPALTPVQTEVIKRVEKAQKDFAEDRSRPQTEELEQVEKDLDELVKKFKIGKLSKPQMIGELSSMEDKLQERREQKEKKLDFRSAKDAAEKPEFTEDVQENMQDGKFKEAAIALDQLKNKMERKLEDGSMTEEDKQQLAKEMKNLAKQADPQSELGKSLSKAADAIESGNKEEMKKQLDSATRDLEEMSNLLSEIASIDNMESLINAQKESLLNEQPQGKQGSNKGSKGQDSQQGQQGSPQSQGGKQGQDSGKSQQSSSQSKEQSGEGQADSGSEQQGNSQSGDQSSGEQSGQSGQQQGQQQGDQTQSGSQQASNQGQQNKGQSGQGQQGDGTQSQSGSSQNGAQGRGGGPQEGSTDQQSNGGMRGAGQGKGGHAPMSDQQTAFVKEKLPQKMDAGEIIAIYKVNGPQNKGEANVEFQQIIESYHQEAEETLNREQIPLHLKGFVGEYFDSIRGEQQQKK